MLPQSSLETKNRHCANNPLNSTAYRRPLVEALGTYKMDHNDSMREAIRDQFILESINSEEVYYLSKNESANCWLDDLEGNYRVPFWPNKKSVKEFLENHPDELKIFNSPLFDFLYFWLPDMFNKLTSVSIIHDGASTEFTADEILMRYDDLLPDNLKVKYDDIETNDSSFEFTDFGPYTTSDAKILIEGFSKANIRYDLEPKQLHVMTPFQALVGGSFGQAPGTFIAVHRDDFEKADEIQKNTLHLET